MRGTHGRLRLGFSAAGLILGVLVGLLSDPEAAPDVLGLALFSAVTFLLYWLLVWSLTGSVVVGMALIAISAMAQAYVGEPDGGAALGFMWLYVAAPPVLIVGIVADLLGRWLQRTRMHRAGPDSSE